MGLTDYSSGTIKVYLFKDSELPPEYQLEIKTNGLENKLDTTTTVHRGRKATLTPRVVYYLPSDLHAQSDAIIRKTVEKEFNKLPKRNRILPTPKYTEERIAFIKFLNKTASYSVVFY